MEKIYYFLICEYDFLQSHIFSVPTQLTWDQEEIHITHQPKVILQNKGKIHQMISMSVYIDDFVCTFSGLFNSIKEETPSTNPLTIVEEKAKEKRDVGLTENSMEAYPGPPPLPSVPITRTNTA